MKLILFGLPIALLLASCSLQDGELKSPTSPPILTGSIAEAAGKGKVYVVLYDLGNKQPRPIADQMVPKGHWFDFVAPIAAEFGAAAFEGLNGNLRQDVGEPAGYTRFPKVVASAKGGAQPVPARTIALRPRTKTIKNPLVIPRGYVPVAKTGGGSRRRSAPVIPSKKDLQPKKVAKEDVGKRSAKPIKGLQPPLAHLPSAVPSLVVASSIWPTPDSALRRPPLAFPMPMGSSKRMGQGVISRITIVLTRRPCSSSMVQEETGGPSSRGLILDDSNHWSIITLQAPYLSAPQKRCIA
ncbi:MAG: hypothetical protein ACI957_004603 [Verrucomicrobiales bacterium]|jgi:hypothetical protein